MRKISLHFEGNLSCIIQVGGLPIAVAGIDLEQFLKGAEVAEQDFSNTDVEYNAAA